MVRVRTKYGAVPTTIDGIRFDSRAESRRYLLLKVLLAAGEITGLKVHSKWDLVIAGEKVGTYVDDFQYTDKSGKLVVEDVKGVVTPVFRLKSKLMRALYGVTISVVSAS